MIKRRRAVLEWVRRDRDWRGIALTWAMSLGVVAIWTVVYEVADALSRWLAQ